jgi:hypothetical protein
MISSGVGAEVEAFDISSGWGTTFRGREMAVKHGSDAVMKRKKDYDGPMS